MAYYYLILIRITFDSDFTLSNTLNSLKSYLDVRI